MKTEILRFWAKTTHDAARHEHAFHPLVCHLIDVGTAALMLWNEVLPDVTKKRLAEPFGFGEDESDKAGNLIAFLVGLHDLGKCSPPFALRGEYDKIHWKNKQTVKLLELYRNTDCFCGDFKSAAEAPHNFVTAVILPPILRDDFGFPETLATNVAEIVGGHHGTFPDSNFLNKGKSEAFCGDEHWRTAQAELTARLAVLFGIEKLSSLPDEKLDNATAMIFAGLTTVADWIGSNTDFFKCRIEDWRAVLDENYEWFDLEDYFRDSKRQAAKALKELGWTNWVKKSDEKSFDELFSHLRDKHRDLQDAAIEIAGEREFDSPGIAVVEAPTGEGKTEAAMFLADAWNARLGTRGIYFALPTQATSNQMFSRVREFLRGRFADRAEEFAHLLLQHGHSSISAEFAENIREFRGIQNISDDAADRKSFSNVVAAEWFTYKKRGLLAPFGVGTVDQILLAVLQTKHVFVRLFGLAHKTVVIDEVHAYDAYMSALLERLLEWLAALGSPVVLLSATLPVKKRDALVRAYLKGSGQKFDGDGGDLTKTGDADKYPRISYATAATEKSFKIRALETSVQNTKTLFLEWKSEDDFVEELKSKLAGGGCAAIICNTVDKAQTLYAKLSGDEFFRGDDEKDKLPKLDLLHARFRFADRERREKRALLRFGKEGARVSFVENGETIEKTVKRPRTAVLIATQIIEQSLDLDFDLMISELAPADLLLQRAGRLQRHKRNRQDQFKEKTALWLIKPPTNADGSLIVKGNLPDFGKSVFVYDEHILLRSWLRLYKKDGEAVEIKIPDQIEELIEDVYDTDKKCLDDKYEKVWNETFAKYEKDLSDEEGEAENRWIAKPLAPQELYRIVGKQEEQLEEDSLAFHEMFRALTRLNADSIKIICLYGSKTEAFLDADGENPAEIKDVISSENDDEERREIVKENIRRLLYNSIPINRRDLILAVLRDEKTAIPSEWEKCALLKSCRVLWLDEESSAEIEDFSIYLHPRLGLRVA